MSGKLQEFDDKTFQNVVLQSPCPVLVDFWAPWCSPCRAMTPIIEQIAAEMADSWLIGKLDIQSNPQTASRYGVRSIPSLMFFDQGQYKATLIGTQTKTAILDKMKEIKE